MKLLFIIISVFASTGSAIKCYQCSSSMEEKGEDNCGAYAGFRKDKHIPVECNSDESVTVGTFCVKITEQSPRGFIWDGRWRSVHRRCASVTETGVVGVCNWGVREDGVYWEECYCAQDGCNGGTDLKIAFSLVSFLISVHILF
ncbi:uncharacterized protein LOC136041240 [Artemia franciscana]|uniref:uncharacterized protein LOC136041240 n=1 Tax=Artemia franciscana TaxID=6661 RepID=UPI0032DB67EC